VGGLYIAHPLFYLSSASLVALTCVLHTTLFASLRQAVQQHVPVIDSSLYPCTNWVCLNQQSMFGRWAFTVARQSVWNVLPDY